jgi:HSP20 family molecular chaperone IbpA
MTSRRGNDWMWADACEMVDRAERLHRQFFHITTTSATKPTWEPPVDVIETSREVMIIVALPGVEPGKVEVAIEGNVVRVAGSRAMPADYQRAAIHRLEIPYGRFERRIGLMWKRLTLTRRELANGCLTLVFAKPE